jgi:transposase
MSYVSEPSAVWGIDIGKAQVAECRDGEEAVQTRANQAPALSAWLRTLPAQALLVVEATNTYHELLATLAHGLGLQVVVLDPRRSWHYARAIGQRGKADRPDARMLARYGAHEWRKLRRWQPPTAGNARLAKLLARRAKLMHAQVMLGQSLSTVAELRPIRTEAQRALRRLIERLDLLILQQVAQDADLAPLHRLLQSIVGVGPLVAAQLAQALTRLPWDRCEAFIAHTGLDPRPQDSGQQRGRRRITKHGPPMLRHLLFMAAMSASKTALWKPTYAALRQRGLASTQALVVLARRIARVAFAMFHSGQPFNPLRLQLASAA